MNADALHTAWADVGIGDDEWRRTLQTFNVAAPAFRDAADGVAVQLRPMTRDDGQR